MSIRLSEQTAPGTPPAGKVYLYAKSDGLLYAKDDAGNEVAVAVALATQAEVDAGTASKVVTSGLNKVSLGTPVATTSGTSVTIASSLPAGIRRITVTFSGVSSNGVSPFLIQLGDSGGIEPSGYVSAAFNLAAQVDSTAGFVVMTASTAALAFHGSITLTLANASTNTWVVEGNINSSGSGNAWGCSGSKSLSAVLDRLALTTVGGSDTFDAGEVNVSYER